MKGNFWLTELGARFEAQSNPAAADCACPFLLSTPSLLDYKNPLVETHESKVKQWIGKLPVMNLPYSTRALLETLMLLNEQPLEEKQRVQLLDLYRIPINAMLLNFKLLHLRQFPLPSAQRQQVAQNLARLPLLLADGYKTVIKQGYHLGHKPAQNSPLLLAAVRACEQLSHALLHLFRISHPVPPQLHLELNQLYRYAEHYQVLDCVPHASKRADSEKAIAATYKQLMLLAIAAPSQLAEAQILPAYELLGQLLDYVEIFPPHGVLPEQRYFAVDLSSDHPPKALPPHSFASKSKDLRLFNTASLLRKLGELLHQAENSAAKPSHPQHTQLLRRLAPYLNASYPRPSPGKPTLK